MKKATKKAKSLNNITSSGAVLLIFVLGILLFVGPEFFGDKAKGFVISEIMTENLSAACGSDGEFSDCIEITNKTRHSLNLKGVGLTDSEGGAKYIFPDLRVDGGESVLVFCGSDLPFSLKSSGETVRLLSRTGKTVSKVTTVHTEDNQSLALIDGEYVVTDQISPGFPNTEDGIADYLSSRISQDPPLVISEFIAKNYSVLEGGAQLVEVQNISRNPLELSDFYIKTICADSACRKAAFSPAMCGSSDSAEKTRTRPSAFPRMKPPF